MKRGFLLKSLDIGPSNESKPQPAPSETAPPRSLASDATQPGQSQGVQINPLIMSYSKEKCAEIIQTLKDLAKLGVGKVLPASVIDTGENVDRDPKSFIITAQPANTPTGCICPDGQTQCVVTPDIKEILTAYPGFPQAVPRPPTQVYKIAIHPINPDKGLSMFATCQITKGQRIVVERPFIIASPVLHFGVPNIMGGLTLPPTVELHNAWNLHQWEQYLEIAFQRLPSKHQKAYKALYNSHTDDATPPLAGIYRTNSLALNAIMDRRMTQHMPYGAVCNDISRVNHSCMNNATWSFNQASLAVELLANQDIDEGQEITITYLNKSLPFESRRTTLTRYGFQCDCSRCLRRE